MSFLVVRVSNKLRRCAAADDRQKTVFCLLSFLEIPPFPSSHFDVLVTAHLRSMPTRVAEQNNIPRPSRELMKHIFLKLHVTHLYTYKDYIT